MQDMTNKVALITGGGTGIGRETAIAFARRGATVALCGRREAEGLETLELVRRAGSDGFFQVADVSRAGDVEALVDAVVSRYGRIDYAFNNAGVSGPLMPTGELDEDSWDEVITINLKGVWLSLKYQIRQMLRQGGGAIVNMSSAGGLIGLPGASAYIASKHGVIGLTRTAALEYARAGIRVNAVCPGGILTDMVHAAFPEGSEARAGFVAIHPIGRLGDVREVSGAVVWLCSDEASFVTGHALSIDGGATAGLAACFQRTPRGRPGAPRGAPGLPDGAAPL
jgi:NAD(P)-dependent dehydrogenase (short-subunit alcohol dehydrogenase family)